MINILVLLSLIGFASSSCDFSSDFCSISGVDCPSEGLSRDTTSNSFQIGANSYAGWNFDVISLNDLTLNHGDIQGRVAVKNNFYGTNGISVGDLLTDTLDFSVVVGGDLQWDNTGEVYPLNENIFVGGAASLPDNIRPRVTASCNGNSGCLAATFDSVANYWLSFSSFLALQASNVNTSFAEGVVTLSCQSNSDVYYVSFSPAEFNTVIGYSISSSCQSSAAWVFNIIGDQEVVFGGNPIVAAGYVIFNVAPAAKIVISSSVNGNIVAPYSDINMIGGTVVGQIIAGNFTNIIQVNRPLCPSGSSASGSASGSVSGSVSGSATGSASASASATASASGDSDSASASASASGSASGSASTASATGSASSGSISGSNIGVNNNEDTSAFNGAGSLIASSAMIILACALAML